VNPGDRAVLGHDPAEIVEVVDSDGYAATIRFAGGGQLHKVRIARWLTLVDPAAPLGVVKASRPTQQLSLEGIDEP
jgi:hypothetical protein